MPQTFLYGSATMALSEVLRRVKQRDARHAISCKILRLSSRTTILALQSEAGAVNARDMGLFSSKTKHSDFMICVETRAPPKAAITTAYCILKERRQKSDKIILSVRFDKDFKSGQTDTFSIKDQTIKEVDSIELWTDAEAIVDGWIIETISVINETEETKTIFPVFLSVQSEANYQLAVPDGLLPQYDGKQEIRQKELERKRQEYQLEQKFPEFLPQVKNLPRDERFSICYTIVIVTMDVVLYFVGKFVQLKTWKWNSLDDIKKVYTKYIFKKPSNTKRWDDDVAFGLQRLAGVNNSSIKLCKEIPNKLAVTNAMLEPFLEDLTLEMALKARRIFIVDYELLDECPTSPDAVSAAPIALFFQRNDGNIVPIAIQLLQDKADDNPVFLPSDPKYTWILAKMWFNNADTAMQQAITHLGFAHLAMEGMAVITHRNLSESHPLFKLLAPHFRYLLAINQDAIVTLLAPCGWVDQAMTVAVAGVLKLIRKKKPNWRMNVEGTLPADLKARGVDDLDILPHYHFREDALLLYNCINKYVTDYVEIYYTFGDVVLQDQELQNWRKEMVEHEDKGGLGIRGVAGEEGKFTTRDQVIEVVTSIIYTCSVGHAATNFKQYDEYAYPPNLPSKMKGNLPKTKDAVTEKDLVDSLPDKALTLEVMKITKILSFEGTKPLGDFEVNYIFDPKAVKVVNEFRANLKSASKTINTRNQTRDPPYPYLDPVEVPNSISI